MIAPSFSLGMTICIPQKALIHGAEVATEDLHCALWAKHGQIWEAFRKCRVSKWLEDPKTKKDSRIVNSCFKKTFLSTLSTTNSLIFQLKTFNWKLWLQKLRWQAQCWDSHWRPRRSNIRNVRKPISNDSKHLREPGMLHSCDKRRENWNNGGNIQFITEEHSLEKTKEKKMPCASPVKWRKT